MDQLIVVPVVVSRVDTCLAEVQHWMIWIWVQQADSHWYFSRQHPKIGENKKMEIQIFQFWQKVTTNMSKLVDIA